MKYILISVCDHHFFPAESFNTEEEAHDKMCSHIDEALGYLNGTVKEQYKICNRYGEYKGSDGFVVNTNGAYINRNAKFEDIVWIGTWDFRIFKVSEGAI